MLWHVWEQQENCVQIVDTQYFHRLDLEADTGSSVFEGSECSSSLPRSPTDATHHHDFDRSGQLSWQAGHLISLDSALPTEEVMWLVWFVCLPGFCWNDYTKVETSYPLPSEKRENLLWYFNRESLWRRPIDFLCRARVEEVLNEGGRVRRRREEVVHEAAAVAVPQQSGRR